MGGGDDNVGIAVPNNNDTISGDGNDNVLDENRNNEGGKDVGDDAIIVGKCSDGDNGDGDNCDGIVNSNGGNDSNYVGNLPVSGEAVGERKKTVKTEQQFKGGGDNNVGLDVPNHNVFYSGDGNDNVLDENRKNEGGKNVCDDANNVGKSWDGDNGDGENSWFDKIEIFPESKVVCNDVSCFFQCSLRCLCHLPIFKEILSLCCWLRRPISEVPHSLSRHYLAEPFHPNSVACICIQPSDLR
jgi:hypothetical protein